MPTITLPAPRSAVRPPPLSARNYAHWFRALLFLALLAAPAGVIIHLIATYAVDVPYWDQWETARFFGVTRYHHESLAEIARQQNESRLLFPNLIFLALSLPTGTWSVLREMYFDVALVAVVSAILFGLLRRTGFSLLAQAGLLFLINWILFSVTQEENWFFGIQICYYLVPTALCAALWANVSRHSLGWKTVVSFLLSFVAAYSFSGGVVICALAFPGFLPANWSASGGWRLTRRELGWHVAYVAGSALMLIAYFWGYTNPAGAGSLADVFVHPLVSVSYFFAWLGSPLMPRGPVPQSIIAGVAVFLLLAGLLAASWRSLLDRREQERLYPWVMLAGYAVGTGLTTVIGRSGFGTRQALSSRYITFSSYAYIVILVLAAYLWCFHRQRFAAWARRAALAAGLIILTILGGAFANAQRLTMPSIANDSVYRNFGREGLIFLPLLPTSQNLDSLCGVPAYVNQHAMDLVRRHILDVPQVSAPPLLKCIARVSETGDIAYGSLDEPTFDKNGKVSIRGWAVDPVSKQPGGPVLITCTGPDNVTRPLVVFNTFTYRPEAAPADGIYEQMPCAFMGLASFNRLPPAQYRVAAWRVDLKSSIANQLEDTYLVEWSRSRKVTRDVNAIVFPPLSFRQDNRNGNLDTVALLPDQRLSVSGWAMDANTSAVPRAVLVTCTDSTGRTRLLGTTVPNVPRPDVATSLKNKDLAYAGFQAVVDIGNLPPGEYHVATWGIDNSDEEGAAQMGNVQTVQIPPR